jgi:S-adenosylhomocysteine hydrolase
LFFLDFAKVTNVDIEVKQGLLKNEFILVCGYGRIGRMICEMLDHNFIKYIAIDKRPNKAIDARIKGLNVYLGELSKC